MKPKDCGTDEHLGYEQISDPEHWAYDPEWYLVCDVPETDPWFVIIDQYNAAKAAARGLLRQEEIKRLTSTSSDMANSSTSLDVLAVAGNTVLDLVAIVETYISTKDVCPDLLIAWADMHYALGKIETVYPDLKLKRFAAARSALKQSKLKQRLWYSLWYKQRGSLSRVNLDKVLEELCSKILTDQVLPPSGWTAQTLRNFVVEMAEEGPTQFRLNSGFGKTNLTKAKLAKLASSVKDATKLPPVGIEHYVVANTSVIDPPPHN